MYLHCLSRVTRRRFDWLARHRFLGRGRGYAHDINDYKYLPYNEKKNSSCITQAASMYINFIWNVYTYQSADGDPGTRYATFGTPIGIIVIVRLLLL